MKANKIGYYIDVTCPGCASRLELQENFFTLTCKFCNSVLRIIMPEIPPAYLIKGGLPKNEIRFHIDRHLKKNSLPLTQSSLELKPVYFPYWKIDAVLLKVRNKKILRYAGNTDDQGNEIPYEQQNSDIRLTPYTSTICANPDFPCVPHSIGMRADYIRLEAFTEKNIGEEFTCLPIKKDWTQVTGELKKTITAIDTVNVADFGTNLTELFHPKGAIVYYPYYIAMSDYKGESRRFVIDGKTGQVVHLDNQVLSDTEFISDSASSIEFGRLDIDFHRCTNCGIDLPETRSVVYVCHNCQNLVFLERLPFSVNQVNIVQGSENSKDHMFPFWSLKMSEEDEKKLGQFFGGLYRSDKIVMPAFRMANFEAMYRVTKRFSAAIRTMDLTPLEAPQDENFAPVSLPLEEALILVEAIIYREFIGKQIYGRSVERTFKPAEVNLFFAPFKPQSYFYVDSIYNTITFEKNLVT